MIKISQRTEKVVFLSYEKEKDFETLDCLAS